MKAMGSQIRHSAKHTGVSQRRWLLGDWCVESLEMHRMEAADFAGFDVPRMVICLVGKGRFPFRGGPICCAPAIAAISQDKDDGS